jgi:exopolysaccharide biosynthesis protein
MQTLGCQEALNLDGGGSATVWMLGQVINSPSKGRARDIAHGLVLVQKPQVEAEAAGSKK